MTDVNEDWLAIKERDQKSMKRYQGNDFSQAYTSLQHKCYDVAKALHQQIHENTQLTEQLNY